MKRVSPSCLALLACIGVPAVAPAGPVTDRWSAEAVETRSGREFRSVVTFSYAGEASNERALWRVDVSCEAREPGASWTTTVTGHGKAMLAQGDFAGTADPVGAVLVTEPDNDIATGKGRLEIGDAQCASGIPTIRKLIKSPPRPATAPKAELGGRPWRHNGSIVMVDPATGIVAYLEPKASLRPVVGKGDVLFRGQVHPDRPVAGIAYAFKAGCPPAPYPVRGTYLGPDTLTLRGAGPVRNGCEVVGYSDRSTHALLRFSYLLDD